MDAETPAPARAGTLPGTIIDSVDADDGVLDGKCRKLAGIASLGFTAPAPLAPVTGNSADGSFFGGDPGGANEDRFYGATNAAVSPPAVRFFDRS